MHVNVDTMFLASKHAIPAMIRTAGGGAIANVSSTSALRPRGLTVYTVSKRALIALTKAIAVDHGVNRHAKGTPYRRGRHPRELCRPDQCIRPWSMLEA